MLHTHAPTAGRWPLGVVLALSCRDDSLSPSGPPGVAHLIASLLGLSPLPLDPTPAQVADARAELLRQHPDLPRESPDFGREAWISLQVQTYGERIAVRGRRRVA